MDRNLQLDPKIEMYFQKLDRNPRSLAFAPLAEAYLEHGWVEEARQVCLRGVSLHPNYATGHLILGEIYLKLENYAEARREFEIALELMPGILGANLGIARAAVAEGKHALAREAVRAELALNPNDREALEFMDQVEFRAGAGGSGAPAAAGQGSKRALGPLHLQGACGNRPLRPRPGTLDQAMEELLALPGVSGVVLAGAGGKVIASRIRPRAGGRRTEKAIGQMLARLFECYKIGRPNSKIGLLTQVLVETTKCRMLCLSIEGGYLAVLSNPAAALGPASPQFRDILETIPGLIRDRGGRS